VPAWQICGQEIERLEDTSLDVQGGAAHWWDAVDTAQIAASSCCGSGRVAGSAVSCPVISMMNTPTCRLLPLPFARGGLPEAIHLVPNRLMYSAALPALRRYVGNRLRLSCPMSRLTSPAATTSPPVGTSGNVSLISVMSPLPRGDMMFLIP
jgi:hypothetical protein